LDVVQFRGTLPIVVVIVIETWDWLDRVFDYDYDYDNETPRQADTYSGVILNQA